MEPRSGQIKAQLRWSAQMRRWYVHYADTTHLFVKWENALYFANSAVTTDRREHEGVRGHDAD